MLVLQKVDGVEMKNLRNKNAPPAADLVQYYIDSAYDKVVAVYNSLSSVTALADALGNGTFDNLVYIQDIDTIAELQALVADATLVTTVDINSILNLNALVGENVASEAYVLTQVTGLFDPKGGYDASTNTPDLDVAPSGIKRSDIYVVSAAGNFFGTAVEAGDMLIADQDDPVTVDDWTIINRNIDSSAFATAAQGVLADSAVQPSDNISTLTNDSGFEANAPLASQTEAETGTENTKTMTALRVAQAIAALRAYASQAEAEAGANNTKVMTPLRVAQAIAALGGGGGGGGMTAVYKAADYTAAANEVVYVASDTGQWDITLPVSPNSGDKVSVWDCGDNASVNTINVLRNGSTINGVAADFAINMNGGRFDAMYNGTTWEYSYVVQTTQPTQTITRTRRKFWNAKHFTERLTTVVAKGGQYSEAEVHQWPDTTISHSLTAWRMPDDWDNGAVRIRIIWFPDSVNTGNIQCDVAIFNTPEGSFFGDTAAVYNQQILDTAGGVIDDLNVTPWSALAVPSTIVPGSLVWIKVARDGLHANDTFTGTAEMVGVELEYTEEISLQTATAIASTSAAVHEEIAGTSYTIQEEDNGKILYTTNAASIAITLPDGLPIGHHFSIQQVGVGVPTVTRSGSDTVNGAGTGISPSGQWAALYCNKFAVGQWAGIN